MTLVWKYVQGVSDLPFIFPGTDLIYFSAIIGYSSQTVQ